MSEGRKQNQRIATYQCCQAVRITSRSNSRGNAANINGAERKAPIFDGATTPLVMPRSDMWADADQRAHLTHRQNQNRSQPYPSFRVARRARPERTRRVRLGPSGLILSAWVRSSAPFRTTIFHIAAASLVAPWLRRTCARRSSSPSYAR